MQEPPTSVFAFPPKTTMCALLRAKRLPVEVFRHGEDLANDDAGLAEQLLKSAHAISSACKHALALMFGGLCWGGLSSKGVVCCTDRATTEVNLRPLGVFP